MTKERPIFTEFQSPLPPQRRRPIIRRKSLWTKIIQFPGDLYLQLMERYELIEWEYYCRLLSWPLGISFNLIFFCIQSMSISHTDIYADYPSILATRSTPNAMDAYYYIDSHLLSPSHYFDGVSWDSFPLFSWTFFLQFLLATISAFNAFLFFKKTKSYHILEADPKNPPRSKHIRQVLVGKHIPKWAEYFPGNLIWSYYVRKWPKYSQFSTDLGPKPAYELSIWDISTFHQNIFCLFSPLQAYVYMCFNMDLCTLLILFLLPTMLFYIFDKTNAYVIDKQLIASHVLREYDVKFVHPRLFYQRREVSTNTDTCTETDNIHDFFNSSHSEENENSTHCIPANVNDFYYSNTFQNASTTRKRLFS